MTIDAPRHLNGGYDVAIVGGGPAGMAAALGAREAGAERVLIIDREVEPGGILQQCIHAGFGLHWFDKELTGPEYAARFHAQVRENDVDVLTDAYVLDVDERRGVRTMSPRHGIVRIDARAVVLAMGARERTRGAVRIPGRRPAGVMTAGFAQRLVNLAGLMPGRRVAILGSGDIGLIMARRLVLEGAEVVGVFEAAPHPGGSNRNVAQCLDDFGIPLHLATTVAEIHGDARVTGVTVAPAGPDLAPVAGRGRFVACDTLLTAIGLVPENELARQLRLRLDPVTQGPIVTSAMETSRDGVFAGGNVVHVHDLVDHASQEALLAGRAAAAYAAGTPPRRDDVRLVPGEGVRSVVPHGLASDREHTVYVRVARAFEACTLRLGDAYARPLRYAVPGETVTIKVRPRFLQDHVGDLLKVDVLPREEATT